MKIAAVHIRWDLSDCQLQSSQALFHHGSAELDSAFIPANPPIKFSTPTNTITINQTFQDGDILISKGRKFALGFFSPGKSSYRYVGICYYRIREKTVVWVANRDNPINGSSGVLSLNQLGNLILYPDQDQQFPVWSANVSASPTAAGSTYAAQLLDSGNLVVVQDAGKRIAWQSFDFPTNTLLQGMKVGLNRKKSKTL